jgi:hypothetical protein
VTSLLPSPADNSVPGVEAATWLFTVFAVISTIRSRIHLFAPDGGAGTVAGMDLTVPGADGIIFAFALWGSAQLIYALIQLIVAFRYRSLVPLMYLLLIVETLLRMLVGHMKPVHFSHRPPGGIANYIVLPIAILMLILTLQSSRSNERQTPA